MQPDMRKSRFVPVAVSGGFATLRGSVQPKRFYEASRTGKVEKAMDGVLNDR
jgi:hypothetical protein